MKTQISFDQIEAIEAQCRKMRSEAIFAFFAGLGTRARRAVSRLTAVRRPAKPALPQASIHGNRQPAYATRSNACTYRRIMAD